MPCFGVSGHMILLAKKGEWGASNLAAEAKDLAIQLTCDGGIQQRLRQTLWCSHCNILAANVVLSVKCPPIEKRHQSI